MCSKREEIELYLQDIRKSVKKKKYIISSRDKNEQLFIDYVFTEKMREDILLQLEVEDFVEILNNEHPEFAHEKLYVFGKTIQVLPKFKKVEEEITLYIKINKLNNLCVIVVSFHEQEYPLRYAFK